MDSMESVSLMNEWEMADFMNEKQVECAFG